MSWIKLFFTSVWTFIKPFVITLMTKSGTILASAALQAVNVTAQNCLGQSDTEKRDSAYKLIVEDLKKQGIEIGVEISVSMVNAAIELAVQNMKANQK